MGSARLYLGRANTPFPPLVVTWLNSALEAIWHAASVICVRGGGQYDVICTWCVGSSRHMPSDPGGECIGAVDGIVHISLSMIFGVPL